MNHCCVIGGTGFIGRHVVDLLISNGHQVTVVGRKPFLTSPLPEGVRYVSGDYGDRKLLKDVLKDTEEIINLAYSTVPKTSFENPVQDILSNLPAAVTLFETARDFSIRKIIVVSSGGTIYGKAKTLPVTEDHPTNPISPYGITKLAIEKYAMMFNDLNGLPIVCVRPGNAFGEGQTPFMGQGFVATAIASIMHGQEVSVFGRSGTVRDYVHVIDVAKGIIASLERGNPGSCYNMGCGIGRSNKEVIDAIRPYTESSGFMIKIKELPSRPFDVPANVLDSRKLRDATGWKPSVSFEEGIKRTWNWFINNFNVSRPEGFSDY